MTIMQEAQAARIPAGSRRSAGIVIVPERLRWYREDRGWSYAQLADAVCALGWEYDDGEPLTLTRDSVAKYETPSGLNRRNPSAPVAQALCEALSTLAWVPRYDEHAAYAGHSWERRPDEEISRYRVTVADLRGGEDLPAHDSASAGRKAKAELNRQIRLFAEEHCIPYRYADRRISYHAGLERAFMMHEAGQPEHAVRDAVRHARDTASELLVS